jgi:hypothetical protein
MVKELPIANAKSAYWRMGGSRPFAYFASDEIGGFGLVRQGGFDGSHGVI